MCATRCKCAPRPQPLPSTSACGVSAWQRLRRAPQKTWSQAARPLGRPVVRWYSHPVGVNTPCRMGSPGCRDVPRVVRLAALARADERRRKEIGPSARACSGAAGGAVAVGPRPDGPAPDGPTPASCGCGRAGGARRRRLSALLKYRDHGWTPPLAALLPEQPKDEQPVGLHICANISGRVISDRIGNWLRVGPRSG